MDDLRDPIFKGCTRPAMKMGIPLTPLVVVVGLALLFGVWGAYLLGFMATATVVMVMIPILITMRNVTKKDDQRLSQLMLWCLLRLGNRNRRFWGATSYSPIRYKRR
jgi:type IV secretion system protein VirB3